MANRVVVVGGGVVGCAIAAELAAAGISTTLVEARTIAAGVSGGSLAALVRHFAGPPEELPFVLDSTALWAELAPHLLAEVGIDVEFDICGHVRLTERDGDDSGDTPAHLERLVDAERAAGLDVSVIEASDIRALLPLVDTRVIRFASWCPGDAKINALLACRALAAAVCRRGGEVVIGEPVLEIEAKDHWRVTTPSRSFEADAVVLAAGPWTPNLLARLDEQAAAGLTPRRAQCCATAALPPVIGPVVSKASVGIGVGYAQLHQTRHGEILFNTVVPSTDPRLPGGELDATVDLAFLVTSARTLARLFPPLRSVRLLRSWAACESWTPDQRFLIGPASAHPGLFVAAGDSGTGFLRAPLIARLICDLVLGGTPDHDLASYAPGRVGLAGAPS
jgi:glycine/D-amino acid oxidase-like deaminating enzyme